MSRPRARDTGFSPVTMIVVLVVGLLALTGLGVLAAYAPELKSGDDGGNHALSRSSVGYGALTRLLRATGEPVLLSRGPLSAGAADSLLILTPPVTTRPEQIEDIEHQGPVLIVLPKWAAAPLPDHKGWVTTFGVAEPDLALSVLPQDMRADTTLSVTRGQTPVSLREGDGKTLNDRPLSIESYRTLSGPEWVPVVLDASGGAVVAYHDETGIYVLSDADLLNTQGLKTLEGAKTAIALLDFLRPAASPVVFDLTLHGFQRSRNLGRLLLEPPLLGLTLIMAGLAALAAWQAVIRFGPTRQGRRVVALGKRALADNTAALVRMARREHHMATPYARLVRAWVARAIGAPRHLSDDQLDAFLDRVGATVGATQSYTALAATARAAQNHGDLIRVARDLHRWTKEMTHARQ